MNSAIIYTKPGCTYCDMSKKLFDQHGIQYNDVVVGQDIIREDFLSLFPEAKTVPMIIIDGNKIGGYTELREWLNNRPQLLNG